MFFLSLKEILEILDDLAKEFEFDDSRYLALLIIRNLKKRIVKKIQEKYDNR